VTGVTSASLAKALLEGLAEVQNESLLGSCRSLVQRRKGMKTHLFL